MSKTMNEPGNTGCQNTACKCTGFSTLVVVVILCTAAQIFANVLLATLPQFKSDDTMNSAEKITTTLKEIQYAQAGGKEIYDLYMQLQKAQGEKNKSQIISQIESLGGTVTPSEGTAPTAAAPTPAATTLSAEDIAAIRKDAFIEGNPNAKYTVVEYSDLECPYCILQFQNGVMKQIKDKYKNDVNVIFKPLNLARHPGADQKGMASLCVGKIAGADKYAQFYQAIMKGSDPRGAVYALDKLPALAAELKIDAKKFKTCYDNKETEAQYKAYTTEAMKNKVDGTPTTLIFNNETKKFELVQGAAPITNFEAAFAKLQ
jgi:protein-disulfide isomerase